MNVLKSETFGQTDIGGRANNEDAFVACLTCQVETVTPAGEFAAQLPDSGKQWPGSDDFHRPWVDSFHARMIRDLFHFNVCHSHAFEFVEKKEAWRAITLSIPFFEAANHDRPATPHQ